MHLNVWLQWRQIIANAAEAIFKAQQDIIKVSSILNSAYWRYLNPQVVESKSKALWAENKIFGKCYFYAEQQLAEINMFNTDNSSLC